jgi:hypothetical protein
LKSDAREEKTMYCPECRSEFVEGIVRCVDCDVPLVAWLPPEPRHDAEEQVAVAETSDPAALALMKSVLDAAEIPYVVEGEELLWTVPGGVLGLGVLGGVTARFLVPRSRSEEGREVLETDVRPEGFGEEDAQR